MNDTDSSETRGQARSQSPGPCPVCGAGHTRELLGGLQMPVFCNVTYASSAEAKAQPSGRMSLAVCDWCGHFFNSEFDESLLAYGEHYENSLHFSPTFSAFAANLASDLATRYDLKNKRIVDIGCGKGDFLRLICAAGDNIGYGFDPSYEPDREPGEPLKNLQFFREFFDSSHAELAPDFVSCRQVLEHIADPREFLTELKRSLVSAPHAVVYFEVPNALFTIERNGIWDLIYEHCQYFTHVSLTDLFSRAGFEVLRCEESFGGQYLALEARLADVPHQESRVPDLRQPLAQAEAIRNVASDFSSAHSAIMRRWGDQLARLSEVSPGVVWGAGSKGVSFVNALQPGGRVAAMVDVSPHKQGQFAAGTGHLIVDPEALTEIAPTTVFVMNPVYREEISHDIEKLGLNAELQVVE